MTPLRTHDVVVAGGGPVGLALAIELGRRGHSVAVVERRDTPSPIPRGQNLTPRTMEHFQAWGCEAELRAARTIPRARGGGMTAWGTLFSGWHHDWLTREQLAPFYATTNERLPQYATEAVLRARAAALPSVDLMFGWSVTDVAPDTAGAHAVATGPGGARRTVAGRFLVGCDGARSRVREAAGITETRRDHDRLMVLLVFRSEALSTRMEAAFPGKSFASVLHPDLDGYWQFFGRVAQDHSFFFHAPVPLTTTRETLDAEGLLFRAAGARFDVTLDHVGFWDLRIAIADAYSAGSIHIAGDAAHSHPPYGGYGINTGFEDARNLGWKLAAVLDGWAGPGLLATYDAERRPVFASTAGDFIEASIAGDRAFLRAHDPARDPAGFAAAWGARTAGARDEVDRFEPHYEGSPVVWAEGRPSAVGRHSALARTGHHMPPLRLADGALRAVPAGPGFTLLALGADPAGFAAAAAARRVPLAVVPVADGAARAAAGADLVLLRPDGYVAWSGPAAGADPARILARAVGDG